jgi:hypothetical protein
MRRNFFPVCYQGFVAYVKRLAGDSKFGQFYIFPYQVNSDVSASKVMRHLGCLPASVERIEDNVILIGI